MDQQATPRCIDIPEVVEDAGVEHLDGCSAFGVWAKDHRPEIPFVIGLI